MIDISEIVLRGKRGIGLITLVNNEDFAYFSKWKWYVSHNGYVWRTQYLGGGKYHAKHKRIYLHREVTKAQNGQEVDHINRNKLDNRRINLRFVTRSENTINQKIRSDNSSGVKGIDWKKDIAKWRVRKQINKVRTVLGYADTLDKAKKLIGQRELPTSILRSSN